MEKIDKPSRFLTAPCRVSLLDRYKFVKMIEDKEENKFLMVFGTKYGRFLI